jgi:hypothetical protein
MNHTTKYRGVLGEFWLCATEIEHTAATQHGELSAGPEMIEAIKIIKTVYPGSQAVYMGKPGAVQCEKDSDTPEIITKRPPAQRTQWREHAGIVTPKPGKKYDKQYAIEKQLKLSNRRSD